MFQFAKTHGYVAIFFFISLIIIGVMIFLNLFLAILLDNFEVEDDEEDGASLLVVLCGSALHFVPVRLQTFRLVYR
jgi:hypothetical protein